MFQNKAHHIRAHLIHPLHLKQGHSIRKKAKAVQTGFQVGLNTKMTANRWMKKMKVGRYKTQVESNINQPLMGPGCSSSSGGSSSPPEGETKVSSDGFGYGSAGSTAPESALNSESFSLGGGLLQPPMPKISIKDKLMAQAGIVHASMHEEEHLPLYRYHFDGSERQEPQEWSLCCGLLFKHQPDHHSALFWGGEMGVELFYSYVRTQMVLVALYLGTFVVIFGPAVGRYFEAYDEKHSTAHHPEHPEHHLNNATGFSEHSESEQPSFLAGKNHGGLGTIFINSEQVYSSSILTFHNIENPKFNKS